MGGGAGAIWSRSAPSRYEIAAVLAAGAYDNRRRHAEKRRVCIVVRAPAAANNNRSSRPIVTRAAENHPRENPVFVYFAGYIYV